MATNQVVQGFSTTNRWLLYTSMMLAPAQGISGIGNNCPSNLGFLAYNWYTQIIWYKAVRAKELHALSLAPVHINMTLALSYLGGVTSGNIYMSIFLGLGTAGVILLNTVTSCISYATNQTQGYGQWRFFFFGWRTLTSNWHKFFLLWQIGDGIWAGTCCLLAIIFPVMLNVLDKEKKIELPWWARYPTIPIGALAMLLLGFPLILWMELIVKENKIESETDWVNVWVFAAQVATMVLPSCESCWKGTRKVKAAAGVKMVDMKKGADTNAQGAAAGTV